MSAFSPLADISAETNCILHVDDEPDLADLTATFLEREHDRFDVVTATSASEGLNRLAETDFDCVISDFDMPGRNGIEFLEAVREEYPDLPFILFTGKGSEEVASDAISAGVTDYLQKGSGTDQYTVLANRVSNAIDQYCSQQMIEQSEQRLRAIIDAVPHMLYVIDEDGTYLLANDTLAEFHGRTVDAIEGASVETVLDESVADQFYTGLRDVLDDNTSTYLSELEITNADGESHIFEPRLLPYEPGTTDTRTILGVAVDVTERRQRECELERIHERMQLTLDHTDSVLFELDLETGSVIRHGAFEQFFDRAPAEVPMWVDHLDEVVHPADRELFRRFYRQLIDGKRDGGSLEYRTNLEDGRIRWIRDTVSAETEPSDGRAHALGIARDITEYKERELDLHRKERRYQAVFNDPNILVGLLDTDGTVLDINQTAMEYIGATLDDVTGTPLSETPWFDHSKPLQDDVRDWIDRAARGEYVDFEADLVHQDGKPYSLKGMFRPVTDDDGEVVALLISDRDITEQKERERDLEETNAVLSTLFETLPVGVLAEDASRNVLAVNERLFELFESPSSPEEVIGTDCEQLAEQVSDMFVEAEGFVDHINELVAERKPAESEELSLNDGRTFERSYRPLDLPDGGGHLWVHRDMTTTKQEKEERRKAITTLEELHEVTTDPTSGFEEKITRVLETGCASIGLPHGFLTRIDTDDVAPGTGVQTIIEAVGDHELLQPGEACPLSEAYCRKTIRQDSLLAIHDAIAANWETDPAYETFNLGSYIGAKVKVDDTLYGTLCFASTTPRDDGFTATDEMLVRLMSKWVGYELERQQSTAELQRQNERLEEFASVVSHDLRNPLNVAEGRLELAREECDSEHLDAAALAHKRMNALIDDLLILAREGKKVSDIEPVDLATLSENCWGNIPTAGATLTTDLGRPIRADRSRLQQLLENLMRNAVEHGGEDVTVTVGEADDGFYVEDDGPGIPEDERDDVFNAGYSTAEDGTGFGLSIVKQVADAHDWEVGVTDGSDGGARFEITCVESAAT